MAERIKATVLKTVNPIGFAGSNPASSEWIEKKKADLEIFETHPHTIPAKLFLARIKELDYYQALLFPCSDNGIRRMASRLRTRLWRYAEAGHFGHKDFSVIEVEGGMSVVKNIPSR